MNHGSARRMGRGRDGFTLIEILIVVVILGILAAIVIPQFSNASLTARENTLKDELRYLRTQVVLFRAQHRDVPPGYPGGDMTADPTADAFQEHMTEYSNDVCGVSATMAAAFRFGPYLSKMPPNPLNSLTTVLVVPNGQALPAADGSTGWIYKPQTLEVVANVTGTDRDGTAYSEY